jgi:hypothetical protein
MLSLDLFDSRYERQLREGAVDNLEARRIDDLNMRMLELLDRAKEPAYKKNPAALAGLKRQFQKIKAERDGYFKINPATGMDPTGSLGTTKGHLDVDEGGIPGNVPTEKIPGKEDLLKGKGRSYYEDQKKSSDPVDEHGGGIGPRQHWQDLMQERKLSVGDPIIVTGPNEFEGKTGEVAEFSPSGKFVVVNLYNHGEHSMHLSDVEYNQYADQEDEDDWYDEGVAETVTDPRAGMAEIYRRLAPKIERYRDSFLAGQLYDELENYAELHGAEREFKQMMNGARNRAHMEYDTNPGGFHNWFWFLPFEDEGVAEGWSDAMVSRRTGTPRTPYSVYIKGKKWKDFENDDHAEAVANKLRAKFKADGRDPSVITIAPTDMSEEEQKPGFGEFPPKQEITIVPPKKLKSGETYQDRNKYWQSQGQAPIYKTNEDQDTSGVEQAILKRIMVAHLDLLRQYGPEKVMQAAEEVAYNVGDIGEIGSSDVSGWVKQVQQILGAVA